MAILEIAVKYEGTPADLQRALGDLTRIFGRRSFTDLTPVSPMVIRIIDERTTEREQRLALLEQDIRTFPVSPRVQNLLARTGIATIGDLVSKDAAEVQKIPGLGELALRQILNALDDLGLEFRS